MGRFGFLYISIKEMSKKIIGLAEVQIWISMNVYKGIGKKNHGFQPKYRFGFPIIKNGIRQKNDGLEPKYRFGFAYIYMKEISRKIIRLAEVQIWISLNVN